MLFVFLNRFVMSDPVIEWFWKLESIHDEVALDNVDALIEYLDDNECEDGDCIYLLHQAAIHNSTKCATILLDRGTNVNEIDENLWTLLHFAVLYGRVECVQLLLERGADHEFVNMDGNKPIDLCDPIRNPKTADEIRQLLNGGGQATKAAKPRK